MRDHSWVATHGEGPAPAYRLSIALPENDDASGWNAQDLVAWAGRAPSGEGDRFFEGTFVVGSGALAGLIAGCGAAVLAFRHDGWHFVLPIYCGVLPAVPLGHAFRFSPRRPQPLAVKHYSQMESALLAERQLIPRRAGGRWADRTDQIEDRRSYVRLLVSWGRPDYADRWIVPLDYDPDGSTSGMAY